MSMRILLLLAILGGLGGIVVAIVLIVNFWPRKPRQGFDVLPPDERDRSE